VQQSDTRFSWHSLLSSYDAWRGRLRIEGGGEYDVTVNGPYLEAHP
jgi:hypothetical protein